MKQKEKNYAMYLRSKLKITKIEDYKIFYKNLRLLKLKITKILHNCNSSTKHSYNTEKLGPVIVAFDKERRIPATGASHLKKLTSIKKL